MNDKTKPTFSSKVGNVSVATWSNEKDGRTFRNSTIGVRYRDKSGGYKDGTSYSTQDLLCLIAGAFDVLLQQFASQRDGE